MKYILLIILLPFAYLASGQNEELIWEQEDIICKEHARAEHLSNMSAISTRSNEFAGQTDMHYQLFRWEIDPAEYYIHGEITYHFKSLVPGLTQLILDFSNEMQINSIRRNGIDLAYTHTGDQLLKIDLNKSLNAGELDTLTIDYEGAPPSNGFGSFEQGNHSGVPIIWTLSEPYGVRDWWPAKQDLIDKIDSSDIYITTPSGNLAASNGKLMSIIEEEGKLIHHWRHRYPIAPYLVALAVTNYASYSQFVPVPEGDSIEILNYVYPEELEASKQATLQSVGIMQIFNELFGLYPFAEEKYGHAQFGWGGGMEHQTMSFMLGFGFGLQAHEMAHQWFGDKVTCGSWQDIWLNEGFATYLTGLTYERTSPEEFWPVWKNSTINTATSQPDGSVWVDDTTSVNRIFNGRLSYNKGAYLLHMMRWIMGDSTFFRASRNYLNGAGTAYDFARTEDLKNYMEAESGKDFDEFLADWFYGQGWPSYNLQWTQQSDSLIVHVSQQQSHSSVDFFEMPIPILVVIDGNETIQRVEHTQEVQRFSFYVGDVTVDSVGFDPDKWILSRNNTVTEIITSVDDENADEDIIIYPNPAKDVVQIMSVAQVRHIEIINAIGISNMLEVINNKFDIDAFTPGIYTLLLKDDLHKVIAVKRLVVAE